MKSSLELFNLSCKYHFMTSFHVPNSVIIVLWDMPVLNGEIKKKYIYIIYKYFNLWDKGDYKL